MIKNHFKDLLKGSIIAKLFGFLRESLFFVYLGNSLIYSETLSLFAISSLVALLADSAMLNPLLFPNWRNNKDAKITITFTHIISCLILSCLFFAYNYIFVENTQPLSTQILTVLMWTILMLHGLLYSWLIFNKKFRQHAIVLSLISCVYTVSFIFFLKLEINSYLYSRLCSLLFGALVAFYLLRKSIIFEPIISINRSTEIRDSLMNVFGMNTFILTVFFLRIIFSLFAAQYSAILAYALIVVFTFYTLINKNLLNLAHSFAGSLVDREIHRKQNQYFFVFATVLASIYLILRAGFVGLTRIKLYVDIQLLTQVFELVVVLMPVLYILGRVDIKNSLNGRVAKTRMIRSLVYSFSCTVYLLLYVQSSF